MDIRPVSFLEFRKVFFGPGDKFSFEQQANFLVNIGQVIFGA